MIIIQNGVKIIIGIIGMLSSFILMIYSLYSDKKKQFVNQESEEIVFQDNEGLDSENVNNNHEYDTEDLNFNNSDDTVLLDEESCKDTTMLN